MLSKGLSANTELTLYGVAIDDIDIVESKLEKSLKKSLQQSSGKISFASIIACSDGTQPIFFEEATLLMVGGVGSKDGIPKSIIDNFAVTGEEQPDIRAWTVNGNDQTVMATFDNGSFDEMLFEEPDDNFEDNYDDEEVSTGSIAIRGADGQLYMIPGHSEDYRAPDDMAEMMSQLPGDSIELIDMKNIDSELGGMEGEEFAGGMRATMTRATMTRATMMRATMMRATMMRATMMRATMMRATMVTSDHDDEDR